MDAIVHIGVGKTGTSAIQKTLLLNRKLLKKQGFWVPLSTSRPSGRQDRLGAYALRDDVSADSRKLLKLDASNLDAFRRELEASFAQELSNEGAACHTAILSDEGLASLRTVAEVEALRNFLKPHFENIAIIAYLRRQDLHSASHHSQHVKVGRTGRSVLRRMHFYKYDEFLDMWESVFGDGSVQPRIFERNRMPGGDVVNDFLEACQIQCASSFEFVGNLNESLNAKASVFLTRLNETMGDADRPSRRKGRMRIVRYLLDAFPGKGVRPSRSEAEDFVRLYDEANERVRERWFSEQEHLFTRSFNAYPEVADSPTISDSEMFEMSAQVIAHLVDEYSDLKEEVLTLKRKIADQKEHMSPADEE